MSVAAAICNLTDQFHSVKFTASATKGFIDCECRAAERNEEGKFDRHRFVIQVREGDDEYVQRQLEYAHSMFSGKFKHTVHG